MTFTAKELSAILKAINGQISFYKTDFRHEEELQEALIVKAKVEAMIKIEKIKKGERK